MYIRPVDDKLPHARPGFISKLARDLIIGSASLFSGGVSRSKRGEFTYSTSVDADLVTRSVATEELDKYNYPKAIINKYKLTEILPIYEKNIRKKEPIPIISLHKFDHHHDLISEFSSHHDPIFFEESLEIHPSWGPLHSTSALSISKISKIIHTGEGRLTEAVTRIKKLDPNFDFNEAIRLLPFHMTGPYIINMNEFADLLGELACLTETKEHPEGLVKILEGYHEDLTKKGAPKIVFDALAGAVEFHLAGNDYLGALNAIKCASVLAEYPPPEATVRNYIREVKAGNLTPKEARSYLLQVTAHGAEVTLLRTSDELKAEAALKTFERITKCDSVPYSLKNKDRSVNPLAQKTVNEAKSVVKRALSVHHAFSPFMYLARRPPGKDPSLLARFGRAAARKVTYVNAKDIEGYPARGVMISGIIPGRVFAPDREAKANGLDPFHAYRENWDYLEDEFDDLSSTHFLFTRGLIAISCPGNEKYSIDGVHYSYVIFNDHHLHNKGEVAYLVPTSVLQEKLKGVTVPYGESTGGYNPNYKDINEAGLTPEGLIAACKEKDLKWFDVGCGTNIGGGLCNADELDSAPLYSREKELREQGHTVDIWNRVHKSHLSGKYVWEMTPEQDALMKPFRKRHDDAYRVSNAYQNLLDLCGLADARFHRGFTKGESEIVDELEKLDEDGLPDITHEKQYLTESDGSVEDLYSNPNSRLILSEAYRWHAGGVEEGKTEPNFYPVFVLTPPNDWWTIPESSPVILDTFDMRLTVDGEKIQLPVGGASDFEAEETWYTKVMPHFMDEIDLRPYHRKDVPHLLKA